MDEQLVKFKLEKAARRATLAAGMTDDNFNKRPHAEDAVLNDQVQESIAIKKDNIASGNLTQALTAQGLEPSDSSSSAA